MAPTRIVALTLAAIFAISGCGTGKTSTSSSAGSNATTSEAPTKILTKADLIRGADAICRRINTFRHSETITSPATLARVLPAFAAYEQSAFTSLAKLTAPASMRREWHKILANFRTLADDTQIVAENAKSNTLSKVQRLGRALNHVRRQISTRAAYDGFSDCSSIDN
jgi:uncharacterized protein YceK